MKLNTALIGSIVCIFCSLFLLVPEGRSATVSVAQVAISGSHTVVVKSDGSLWAWGSNRYGQLGNGTITESRVPIQTGTEKNWQMVAAGGCCFQHYFTGKFQDYFAVVMGLIPGLFSLSVIIR